MLTETEFYDRIAESFDVMTNWKSRLALELPFLQSTLVQFNVRSVLDCACGTGWHAIALRKLDYQVAGSDISQAMIARARENAAREHVEIPFAPASFETLRAQYPVRFDALLCLGNSLPHVLSDDAAIDSLKNMHDCLKSGGVLILHNLNYDKRWREKPRWFAVNTGTLGGNETIIWRFADYDQEGIIFNIALFTKGNTDAWSVDVQSTPQRPYQRIEIEDMLLRAGFHDLSFYGSLQGETFDAASSADLVVVAAA
jgi:glycine/sarcosine N-methyltransferase